MIFASLRVPTHEMNTKIRSIRVNKIQINRDCGGKISLNSTLESV